jgi:hypothetical protein
MELLERIDALKTRLERCPPLLGMQLEKLREDWLVTQTYHSNAIEGNTLTLQETMVVLLHGITVDGKLLKDHLEAKFLVWTALLPEERKSKAAQALQERDLETLWSLTDIRPFDRYCAETNAKGRVCRGS